VSVAFTDEAVATAFAGSAVPEQLSHSSFLRESCGRLASRLWRVDTYFGNNRRGPSAISLQRRVGRNRGSGWLADRVDRDAQGVSISRELAAISRWCSRERPERRSYDRRGGADEGARHTERPEQRKWRTRRIVLRLGGRDRQSGEPGSERARDCNLADTHEAPRGSGPRARVSGTRSARKAYLVSRAWASAGGLEVTRALLGRGDMVVQGRLLMTMIETAVENAPQLDQILPAVRDLDEMWPRSAA